MNNKRNLIMKNKAKHSQRGDKNDQGISRRDFVTKTTIAGGYGSLLREGNSIPVRLPLQ
jgi:hypothetical protein